MKRNLTVTDFLDWELVEASLMVGWSYERRRKHCSVCWDEGVTWWCRVGAATVILQKLKAGVEPAHVSTRFVEGACPG